MSEELTEQQVIEKAEEAEMPPEEIAATMFSMYYPRFKNIVSVLSSKARLRLLERLVEHPLGDEDYKWKKDHEGQLEREAFALGVRLLEAKQVMIFKVYSENLPPETLTENKEESTNGTEEVPKV